MTKAKLRDCRGMTILFALLVFLTCGMAGAAALTAASANAGRYSHMRSDQQKYMILSSAARLVEEELSSTTFLAQASLQTTTEETETEVTEVVDGATVVTGYTTHTTITHDFDKTESPGDACSGELSDWIGQRMLHMFFGDIPPGMNRSGDTAPNPETTVVWNGTFPDPADTLPDFTLSGLTVTGNENLTKALYGVPDGGSQNAEAVKVCWEMKMSKNYDITATFWLNGDSSYKTVLTLPAQLRPDSGSGWGTLISKDRFGELGYYGYVSSSSAGNTETTVYTLPLAWPNTGAVFEQVKWD